jgi:ankyrin repeat protein
MEATSETFSCDKCSKTYGTREKYKSVLHSHPLAMELRFQTFSQHRNKHLKRYPCENCNYTSRLRADLSRHVLAHHRVGQPRYPCIVEGCAFKATRKDNIRQHLRKSHPDYPLPPATRRGMKRPSSVTKKNFIPSAQQPPCTSSTLMQAASTGNIGLLEVLLGLGADLSVRADDGSTALHCAVKASQISMVESLLKNGALIDALNQKDQSPLHQAVLNRDRAACKLLMQNGAALSQKVLDDIIKPGLDDMLGDVLHIGGSSLINSQGRYMFKRASEWDQASILLALLRSPFVDRDWIISNGSHTLFTSLVHGRVTTFQCLLTCNKLDPNLRVGRKSLLHIAAVRGQVEVLEIFLQCNGCDVNATDGHGYTPIRRAASKGQTATVRALLSHPQIMANGSGETSSEVKATALHLAVRAGHIDVARLLLEHPGIHVNTRDAEGETPLQLALRSESKATEMVSLFLEYDHVDVAVSRGSEGTLLLSAIARGDEDMVRLLVNHPRTKALAARHGKGAQLHLAVLNLHWDMVHYLLWGDEHDLLEHDGTEHNLHDIRRVRETAVLRALLKEESFLVNKPDQKGQTLLHKLVSTPYSSLHLIEELLRSDHLQPSSIDEDGKTALHYAVSKGQIETIQLLLDDARTDVNAHGSDRETVLRCARRGGNAAIIEMLLRQGAVDGSSSNNHKHSSTPPRTTWEQDTEEEEEEVEDSIWLQQSSGTAPEWQQEDLDYYDSESMDDMPDEHEDTTPKPRLWVKGTSWQAALNNR